MWWHVLVSKMLIVLSSYSTKGLSLRLTLARKQTIHLNQIRRNGQVFQPSAALHPSSKSGMNELEWKLNPKGKERSSNIFIQRIADDQEEWIELSTAGIETGERD